MTPIDWLMSNDTGTSSETILHVMEKCKPPHMGPDIPYDAGDLGRCMRLLEAFPQYRPRMPEIAKKYPDWQPFVDQWEKLTDLYNAKSYQLSSLTREIADGVHAKREARRRARMGK